MTSRSEAVSAGGAWPPCQLGPTPQLPEAAFPVYSPGGPWANAPAAVRRALSSEANGANRGAMPVGRRGMIVSVSKVSVVEVTLFDSGTVVRYPVSDETYAARSLS